MNKWINIQFNVHEVIYGNARVFDMARIVVICKFFKCGYVGGKCGYIFFKLWLYTKKFHNWYGKNCGYLKKEEEKSGYVGELWLYI